jgi:hypothetical protein
MFRKMRRFRQQLSDEEAIKILENGKTGVLAVNGDDGYPYTVPLNYIYKDGKIIIHGAKAGHKYDAMLASDKVSFCVIDKDEIVPEKVTDYYRSVIVFGRVRIIEGDDLKREAALAIGRKYAPEDAVQRDMTRVTQNFVAYEISIEHMTGKEAIELVAMKESQEKE